MATDPAAPFKKIYVILNPIAGHSSAEALSALLEQHCGERGVVYEVYETTGKEDVAEIARQAVKEGAELVIAAGGDGTVAGVVNGLIKTQTPLGILPVGTGNGLARALRIPLDPQEALSLILGKHDLQPIDAMQVGDRHYMLNVSAGISSRAMRETPPEQKQRFGMLAYAWVIVQQLVGYEPRRYNLTIDGHQVQVRAAEVLVSNGTVLQDLPRIFGDPKDMNDGQFDVHILMARTIGDYLRLLGSLLVKPKERKAELRSLPVKKSIVLDAVQRSQPVQADGELIGRTPVEVTLVPGAIRIVVPKSENKDQENGRDHANGSK